MDAVKFLKEMKRICNTVECQTGCPLYDARHDICGMEVPEYLENGDIENIVSAVEKWSAEHPVKTRLMDFLEKHPNAPKENGLPYVRPWDFGYCKAVTCDQCERWVPADYLYRRCWNLPLEE